MFSTEFNGYNRAEVDKYISRLNAQHQASLMEERLKVLESEKKLLDFKSKNYDIENREKNIMTALDAFRRFQDEGNNNIKLLHYEQIKMINDQLHLLYQGLCIQHPDLQGENSFLKLFTSLDNVLSQAKASEGEQAALANTENDSMRRLLNKMQEYRKEQGEPREVYITRVERTNQIKPVSDMTLEEDDKYDNLVDKFLDTAPTEKQRSIKPVESGFDLKEAINPKDDLAEIMKAFDFFNDSQI